MQVSQSVSIKIGAQAVATVRTNQGIPGRDGLNGTDGASVKVAFAYGDATPKLIHITAANEVIFSASIVILEPFNGVGAALQLGDVGDLSRLIAQVDPLQVATFTFTPGFTYTEVTQLLLSITPGAGATQGKGFVLLKI